MSTQIPDPYNIESPTDPSDQSTGEEILSPQGETDDRARPTRMDAIPLEPGRMCINCDYDLTGLFAGGNCPECGDKILSVAPRKEVGAYKRMPNWYLKLLSVVLGLMLIVFLGGVFLTIYSVIAGANPSSLMGFISSVFVVAPYVWLGCVIVICIPPPEREPVLGIGRSLPELALAALAILSQSGVLVVTAYSIFLSATNATSQINLPWTSMMASAIGISIVAIQLGQIASRFDDDDRARMLIYAAVAIVVGDVTFAVLPQPFSLLILGWGYLYFVWSLWVLSREAEWAIHSALAIEARIARLKQRARENYEQAQAEREAEAPFGGPLP